MVTINGITYPEGTTYRQSPYNSTYQIIGPRGEQLATTTEIYQYTTPGRIAEDFSGGQRGSPTPPTQEAMQQYEANKSQYVIPAKDLPPATQYAAEQRAAQDPMNVSSTTIDGQAAVYSIAPEERFTQAQFKGQQLAIPNNPMQALGPTPAAQFKGYGSPAPVSTLGPSSANRLAYQPTQEETEFMFKRGYIENLKKTENTPILGPIAGAIYATPMRIRAEQTPASELYKEAKYRTERREQATLAVGVLSLIGGAGELKGYKSPSLKATFSDPMPPSAKGMVLRDPRISPQSLPKVFEEQRVIGAYAGAENDLMQLGRSAQADALVSRPYTVRLPTSATEETAYTSLPNAQRGRVTSSGQVIKYVKPPKGFEATLKEGNAPFTETTTTEVVSASGEYVKTQGRTQGQIQNVEPLDLLGAVKTPNEAARITPQVQAREAFGSQSANPYAQAKNVKELRLSNADVLTEPVFNKATGTWRVRTASSAGQGPVDWSNPLSVTGGGQGPKMPVTASEPALIRQTRVTTQENTDLINALKEARQPKITQGTGVQISSRPMKPFEASSVKQSEYTGGGVGYSGPDIKVSKLDAALEQTRIQERLTRQRAVEYTNLNKGRYDKPVSYQDVVTKEKPTYLELVGTNRPTSYPVAAQLGRGASIGLLTTSIERNQQRQNNALASQTTQSVAALFGQRTALQTGVIGKPQTLVTEQTAQRTGQITITKIGQPQAQIITPLTYGLIRPGDTTPPKPPEGGGGGGGGGDGGRGGGVGIPASDLPFGAAGKGFGRLFGGGRPSRYAPSLVGLFSGRTIRRAPIRLTGAEIRFPVMPFIGKKGRRR